MTYALLRAHAAQLPILYGELEDRERYISELETRLHEAENSQNEWKNRAQESEITIDDLRKKINSLVVDLHIKDQSVLFLSSSYFLVCIVSSLFP